MSDYRDRLEQERRRFAMSGDSFQDLERRRDRKRRNRRLASGAVALAIAVVGVGGALYAFRPTDSARPAVTATTPSSIATSLSPSPSGTIQFLDDQNGWAVFNEQLVSTSDGGMTWHPVDTGATSVGSVDFVDPQYGWVLASDGLLATTDGGANWERAYDQPFKTVVFVDSLTGWGIGSDSNQPASLLVKTTDGGRSWQSLGVAPDSVCVGTDGRVWAAGLSGDGGVISVFRWDAGQEGIETRLPIPSGEPWTATIRCASDGSEAFVLVTGGGAAGHVGYAVFQVTPGSGTSDDVHPVLVASIAAAEFGLDAYMDDDPYPGVFTVVDPGRAYFVNWCPACEGAWASFVQTQGEPATVTNRTALSPSGNPSEPVGITFVDPDHGWVLFQGGLVLNTQDGGISWGSPCEGATCFGIHPSP